MGAPVFVPPTIARPDFAPSETIAGVYTVSDPGKPVSAKYARARNRQFRQEESAKRADHSRASIVKGEARPTMPILLEPAPAPRIPWESFSIGVDPARDCQPTAMPLTYHDSGFSPSQLSAKTGNPLELGNSAFYLESKQFQKNGKPKLIKMPIFRAEIRADGKVARKFTVVKRSSQITIAEHAQEIARMCGQSAADNFLAGCQLIAA